MVPSSLKMCPRTAGETTAEWEEDPLPASAVTHVLKEEEEGEQGGRPEEERPGEQKPFTSFNHNSFMEFRIIILIFPILLHSL